MHCINIVHFKNVLKCRLFHILKNIDNLNIAWNSGISFWSLGTFAAQFHLFRVLIGWLIVFLPSATRVPEAF